MTLPRMAGLQSSGTWKGRNAGQDTKQSVPVPWSAPPATHREGHNRREHTLYTRLTPRGSHKNHYSGFFPGAFSRWRSGKESGYQCRRCKRHRFDPWVRKIPCSRKWQPTPVFLPGEPHRQSSLAGDSPWGHKELDATAPTNAHSLKTYGLAFDHCQ